MLPNDWTRMQYKRVALPSLQLSEVENRWNGAISLLAIQIASVTVSLQWRDVNSVTELIKRGRGWLAVISIRGMHPNPHCIRVQCIFICISAVRAIYAGCSRLYNLLEMLSAYSFVYIQIRPFLKRKTVGLWDRHIVWFCLCCYPPSSTFKLADDFHNIGCKRDDRDVQRPARCVRTEAKLVNYI